MTLLVMALILAGVLAAQYLVYRYVGPKHITYTLNISKTEVFEDEEIDIIEEIENNKRLPLPWVRTEINCSRWLSFHGQSAINGGDEQKGLISGIFILKGYQKCRRSWRVKCEKRGLASIDDVTLSISDLFGLTKPAIVFKGFIQIRVLPSPADIALDKLSDRVYIGELPVSRFVLPDPFVISGASEYTGHEPMNRIHRTLSAKNSRLMVYNNEFTTERRMLIVLNMQRGFYGEKERLAVNVMEAQIKAAAFLLDYCYETRIQVGLAANCPNKLSIAPEDGYEHIMSVLRQLAELENRCGEHIDDFIKTVDFSEYTDIAFITCFVSEVMEDSIGALRKNGHCVMLLSTQISECGACEVLHIPQTKRYANSE